MDTRKRKRDGGKPGRAFSEAKDDETFTIQQFELCLRHKDSSRLPGPSDTDLFVFSSANGLAHAGQDGDTSQRNAATRGGPGVLGPTSEPNESGANKRRRKALVDSLEFGGIASNRAASSSCLCFCTCCCCSALNRHHLNPYIYL